MNEKYSFKKEDMLKWENHLIEEERSRLTIEKYVRDLHKLYDALGDEKKIDKKVLIQWKESLKETYAMRSVNSILAAVNNFFLFMGWNDLCLKTCRIQKEVYERKNKELSKAEYQRLIRAAGKDERLKLIMETIGATGIRISELKYFTVEALSENTVMVYCKRKARNILIPKGLKKMLVAYAKKYNIKSGYLFCTKSGKPVDRSNVWAAMKRLCQKAQVSASKVFPHNFRKLFARTFYALEKDMAKLADLLGHSSIETTRIYIMTTSEKHMEQMEKMDLLL